MKVWYTEPMTTTPTTQQDRWVIKHIHERVESRWGKYPRDILGDTLYEAVLNEALLLLCASQDDEVDPAIVVRIMKAGRTAIIEEIHA